MAALTADSIEQVDAECCALALSALSPRFRHAPASHIETACRAALLLAQGDADLELDAAGRQRVWGALLQAVPATTDTKLATCINSRFVELAEAALSGAQGDAGGLAAADVAAAPPADLRGAGGRAKIVAALRGIVGHAQSPELIVHRAKSLLAEHERDE